VRSVPIRAAIHRILPEGGKLPPAVWASRHQWIVRLLWFHVAVVVTMALVRHNSVLHALAEASPVAAAAVLARSGLLPSRWRAATATAGLVTASAVLVHLSGGLVEMHFHFFVMIALVTLYQDWVPFLVALGFVVLHHAVVGTADPTSVYNHPAAWANPAKWAFVHGLFVLAASAAGIANWRLNEIALAARQRSEDRLGEAQRLAHLGSWQWDVTADSITWSDELFRIFGLEPGELEATYAGYLALVHPDDREQVQEDVSRTMSGGPGEFEHRIVRSDGEIRWLQSWSHVVTDEDGKPVRLTGSAQDVTDRKRAEQALAHQALHDSLTGLANRALFGDRLEHALARQVRAGTLSAVLFIDLDDFKTVNDGLGHAEGDQLLVAVSERLAAGLRAEDTAARLGGDEFAILLEGLREPDRAEAVARRLMETLRDPFDIDGSLITISGSIGIAVAGPGSDPRELLRQADVAMYRAKSEGKNRFCVFEPGMHGEAMQRLELKAELQRAVENGEFVNYYQPLVDLETGGIVGVEALVRWRHPERGLLGPGAFMPMAEETGLVVPVGRQVLWEACRQARAWQTLRPGLAVNVNLSARQLQDAGLVEDVSGALLSAGLDPACLTLEITESVLVDDDAAAARTLARLKALRVGIALDDFGTGYSSLSHLERFPVDVLKVDKRFVDGLGEGETPPLTRAILGLGGMLGLKVVAEGIERPEQLAALRQLGCRWGQGYLFARPLPADEVTGLLERSPSIAVAAP
jgi:diguanylate cyclase (GGDEF)-like protein/PAS domain S-box-containing protein